MFAIYAHAMQLLAKEVSEKLPSLKKAEISEDLEATLNTFITDLNVTATFMILNLNDLPAKLLSLKKTSEKLSTQAKVENNEECKAFSEKALNILTNYEEECKKEKAKSKDAEFKAVCEEFNSHARKFW